MITTDHDQLGASNATADPPWYVYVRYIHLLHIAPTLETAERWTKEHWVVSEVASREEIATNDYWYFLRTSPGTSADYHNAARQAPEYQARIIRMDRVVAIGRNPDDKPATPDPDLPGKKT